MIGVTFYNRGKATSNRARYSPAYILEEPRFDIRNRLVGAGKPIIIDEVGTTSIWYEGAYDRETSLEYYEKGHGHFLKNLRL